MAKNATRFSVSDLPSLPDVCYFMEVAHTGNITRAANNLGISQPSLSVALQRVEASLGTSLLLRTNQGIRLTEAGSRFAKQAERLVHDWRTLRNSVQEGADLVQGRVSIGCHPSVAQYSLPAFIGTLLKKHSLLEVSLHHDLSRKIVDSVVEFKLDLGLVINPVKHPELVLTKLCEDDVTLWKSKTCANPDVLICDMSLAQTQHILQQLKSKKDQFKRIVSSGNLDVIASLVAVGAGVGILPSRVARRAEQDGKLVSFGPSYRDALYLVYRRELRTLPAIRAVVESLQKVSF